MSEMIFTNLANPSGRTSPWDLISLWQKTGPEAKIKMFLGSRGQPTNEA
jgi:hypothetical protein